MELTPDHPNEIEHLQKSEDAGTVEELYNKTGGCGRFQWLLGFFVQMATMLPVGRMTLFSFGMLEPTYECGDVSINFTSACQMKANCTNLSVSSYFMSFAQEFDLECTGRGYLPTLLISISYAFTLPVLLISGYTSDHLWGRRLQIIVARFGTIFCYIIVGLSKTFEMFMVFVILGSICNGFLLAPILTFQLEFVTTEYRILMALATQWSISYGLAALFAYLCGNWSFATLYYIDMELTPDHPNEIEHLQKSEDAGTVEELYNKTGGCGRFQWLLGFFVQMATMLPVGRMTLFSFGMLEPTYECGDVSINFTSACQMKANCTNLSVSSYFMSFAQEFDLECTGRGYLPTLLISISYAFTLPVLLTSGYTSDHLWGRRLQIIVARFGTILCYIIVGLSKTFEMFMVFVILGSICNGFLLAPILTFQLEFVTTEYRILMALATQWSISYGLAALFAYLCGNWRYYIIICCLYASVSLVGLVFVVPESPRWLIQKGKFERAQIGIRRMARINGIKNHQQIPLEALQYLRNSTGANSSEMLAQKRYNVLDLFRNRYLAKITLVQSVSAFNLASVGSIILYGTDSLVGSPFLNIAMSGILRLWVPPALYYLDKKSLKFGRRQLICLAIIVCMICLLANAGIILGGELDQLALMVTVFAQVATITNAGIFSVGLDAANAELFPTVLRNTGQSFVVVVGIMGAIAAPQVIYLRKIWPVAPYLIMGISFAVNLILVIFLLPETKSINLPDQVVKI